MSDWRWVLVSVGCLAVLCPAWAGEGAPAAPGAQATQFYRLDTAGLPTRVDAEVMGIVLQELRLVELRNTQNARDYRLSMLLRNSGQAPATPMLRVVLWSEKKPEAAFDIRGQERHVSLQPRTVMRFIGDFELDRQVKVSRFTLVPLPPEEFVMRADEPLPVTPTPPEKLLRPTNPPVAGDKPAKEGEEAGKEGKKPGEGEELDPERVRELERALAHYRAVAQQMYLQQVTIPEVNAIGTLAGIGPYGPVYQVGGRGGSGLNRLYVQSPSGWSPLQAMPMMMNPMNVWVDPFQRGGRR